MINIKKTSVFLQIISTEWGGGRGGGGGGKAAIFSQY